MKIGIDVTWLKPNKSGGVESYLRNLLDGFIKIDNNNEYILFCAKDNYESMSSYEKDKRFRIVVCNTYANAVLNHMMYINLKFFPKVKKYNIDCCFFPVYMMPIIKFNKIKCITTIHDIQAIHYPKYFSKFENIYFRIGWKAALNNSNKVVAITNYTKKDLINNFGNYKNIEVIYNPIVTDQDEVSFNDIKEKYNLRKGKYYYTISSMHEHKNLISLIKTIKYIKEKNVNTIPNKLVISGIGGPNKEKLLSIIDEYRINDNIVITNFVSNAERNALIKNCNCFLFPSVFEGFGMPPIEAMRFGAKVITTKYTSLPEVTQNKCHYVSNPFDEKKWLKKIEEVQKKRIKKYRFEEYECCSIATKYLELFDNVINNEK